MKKKLKSIRVKAFIVLSIAIIYTVLFVIVANSFLSESLYLYSKRDALIDVYNRLNNSYTRDGSIDLELELERASLNNNFDIVIKTNQNVILYTSSKNFVDINTILASIPIGDIISSVDKKDIIYSKDNVNIIRFHDDKTDLDFLTLTGELKNGDTIYIRMPLSSIRVNSQIANRTLLVTSGITLLLGAVITLVVSKKIADPILELNEIAKDMSNLKFDKKYKVRNTDNEINDLGNSINIMSEKLEKTINELQRNNSELEKDIEEKSKINEMRQQFISDVSHELKTPIALIQGYAEGLVENVAQDEESRKYYAEIILDETNKMDKLVEQLLELSKLEYKAMQFNNTEFDIVELLKETVRKSKLLIEERNINLEIQETEPVIVNADEFYIEQIITNYLTNAIKYAKEVDGDKKISINIYKGVNKVRITVFNTGDNISEENKQRIWNRFFKVDASRNRESGGTGIGLSIVRAIMNNYDNQYGVDNKENGVEFYFELDLAKE